MKIRSAGALLLATLGLASCSRGSGGMGEPEEGGGEAVLRALYEDFPQETRYFEGWTDLNGDGIDEWIVYVAGPEVCGSGGCDTLIFTRSSISDGYELVTRITVTRPSIRVLSRTSEGWRNILVHVSGGGILPGYEAELAFDGRSYPDNPTVEPAQPAPDTEGAEILIPEFVSFLEGKPLFDS